MNHIDVLDHGYVKLRNISGPTRRAYAEFDADDVDPANAARKSFDQMDKDRPRKDDIKLDGYLMSHWHTTPFEMVVVWLEMKLPIFVARQFVRHRTVSIDEVSARYTTLPEEWYIPNIVLAQPEKKKQGGVDTLDLAVQQQFRETLNAQCADSYRKYLTAIDAGVALEQARLFLHLNHYTRWLWKQDLHNVMHFLSRRDHSSAQDEAAVYGKAVDKLIRQQLPECMDLYDRYRRLEEPDD